MELYCLLSVLNKDFLLHIFSLSYLLLLKMSERTKELCDADRLHILSVQFGHVLQGFVVYSKTVETACRFAIVSFRQFLKKYGGRFTPLR